MITIIAVLFGIIITIIALVLDLIILGPIGLVLVIPILVGWLLGAQHARKEKEESK